MAYKHLQFQERTVISIFLTEGLSIQKIADFLTRSRTTIYREIKRNSKNGKYNFDYAQTFYKFRRSRKGFLKFTKNYKLLVFVLIKLTIKSSPKQIVSFLKNAFPNDKTMRISHETIYKYIYLLAKMGIDYIQYMRKGKKTRQSRKKKAKSTLKDGFRTIYERNKNEDLDEIGHWESDLIEGKKGKGFIITLVEKITKYTIGVPIRNKDIKSFNEGIKLAFSNIDNDKIKSITHDRGSEAYDFENLEEILQAKVYYADPGKPWQRPLNENTNGMLRQYFPKGYDFTKLSQKYIDKSIEEFNNRPRIILNGKSNREAFFNLPINTELHFNLTPRN